MSSPCQCGKRLSLIHFHTCGYSVHQKLVGTSFLFNTPSLSSLQDATHKCVTKIHLPMIDITMYLNQYSLYGLTKCLVDFSNYPDYPARWMKMNELCFFFFFGISFKWNWVEILLWIFFYSCSLQLCCHGPLGDLWNFIWVNKALNWCSQ